MNAIATVDPSTLLRLLAVGSLTYVVLVATLRLSGKRTLAKLNAFDLVVTVALGSTLSSALLSRDVTLPQSATAILLLVALQYLVTWSSVRVRWIRRVTRSEPTLLFQQGQYHRGRMQAERITEAEVRQAMRGSGFADTTRVGAVVLETDGTLSVLGELGDLTNVHS